MTTNQVVLWIGFGVFVVLLLAVDLGVFHRRSSVISVKESLIWSGIWTAIALLFNIIIFFWHGQDRAVEFLAGYLIERSLSVDNLFVFLMIFSYFQVPETHQYKVLFWGIVVALLMRALFIATGLTLIEHFDWIIYLFGAFLIVTGIKMALQREANVQPDRNPVVRMFRSVVPATDHYDGGRFITRAHGRTMATPLLIVLIAVEVTDLVFAVDSIPAVFAVTVDPFVVYTSNVFAVLGLRALYFALAACAHMFHYLNHGVILILIFVGIKMLLSDLYEIPVTFALGFIALVLLVSILASLARTSDREQVLNCLKSFSGK